MIDTERAAIVATRIESLRRQGLVTDHVAEIANGEAELTELAFESGQAVLERTLITFRNHADWDSHERACFGEMRIETIADEAGVSATSIGRREDGALAILSHAAVRALIVEKGQRGAYGRNDAHVYKIGPGSLREQFRRLRNAGHRLDAAVAIAVAVLGAYDLELGYSEITLAQLAHATGLKPKTVRQVVAKWGRSRRLICVGPNLFVFGHGNWRGDRFPIYHGPNFETAGCQTAISRTPNRSLMDVHEIAVWPRNCGHKKNSTSLRVDIQDSKTPTGEDDTSAVARKRAKAAADHRHHRPERVKIDLDALKARARSALDQAGSLSELSDEVSSELLAEAVRGAMPEDKIERETDLALSMFRRWAELIPQTGLDWCPEVLFVLLRQKAERAGRINSWTFFGFVENDFARHLKPDIPSASPCASEVRATTVEVAVEMAQVRPDPAAAARKHHDEAKVLRMKFPRFRSDVIAAVSATAPISERKTEAHITQAIDGMLAAAIKAELEPNSVVAIIAKASERLVAEGRRFDVWGNDHGGVRRALDDAINALKSPPRHTAGCSQ